MTFYHNILQWVYKHERGPNLNLSFGKINTQINDIKIKY